MYIHVCTYMKKINQTESLRVVVNHEHVVIHKEETKERDEPSFKQ